MSFLETILIFAIIVFIGYFIKSLTGFAGALFSIPLLVLFFDIKMVILIISLLDMLSGLILIPTIKKIDKKELFFILVGGFLGTILGVYLLKSLASDSLKLIFAILIILFSLRMIFKKYFSFKKLKSYFGFLFGGLGGITGGMFGTNGPPIVLYLGNQIRNKHILRGTLIVVLLISAIFRNGLYFFTNTFNNNIYIIVLFAIPILVISTILGSRVYQKINQELYQKIISIILLINGIILIF